MSYKISIKGNAFYVDDLETPRRYEANAKDCLLLRLDDTSTSFSFKNLNNWDKSKIIEFSEVDLTGADYTDLTTFVAWCEDNLGKSNPQASGIIYVNQKNYIKELSNIDEKKEYYFNEEVTFMQTIVLDKSITIRSHGTNTSRIISGGAFPLFSSGAGSSGNVFMYNVSIDNSFIGSTVFDLVAATGFETIQLIDVNFVNSEGIGEINGYRQFFGSIVAYIGGKPSLTFSGNFGGVKISNFNGINISDAMTEPVFKEGASLVFSSTVDLEGKIDLGSTAALFDFKESNFTLKESLIPNNLTVLRNNIEDASDTTIHPNIDNKSVNSLWSKNTGLPNTTKYIKGSCVSEVETIVSSQGVYYPLLGTVTINENSHFDSPSNGQYRLLSGNGTYNITGYFVLDSRQNDELHIRVVKSEDGGVTFTNEINHIKGIVNSLSGGRDVAFLNINFISTLKENEILRVEVENESSNQNITQELDSYLIITGL